MSLGMDLSKVLFSAEPLLLDNDIRATARAAGAVSNLLGCILGAVLLKRPGEYEGLLEAVMQEIHQSAMDTVERARSLPPEQVQ